MCGRLAEAVSGVDCCCSQRLRHRHTHQHASEVHHSGLQRRTTAKFVLIYTRDSTKKVFCFNRCFTRESRKSVLENCDYLYIWERLFQLKQTTPVRTIKASRVTHQWSSNNSTIKLLTFCDAVTLTYSAVKFAVDSLEFQLFTSLECSQHLNCEKFKVADSVSWHKRYKIKSWESNRLFWKNPFNSMKTFVPSPKKTLQQHSLQCHRRVFFVDC
jgi:hypothetical protein